MKKSLALLLAGALALVSISSVAASDTEADAINAIDAAYGDGALTIDEVYSQVSLVWTELPADSPCEQYAEDLAAIAYFISIFEDADEDTKVYLTPALGGVANIDLDASEYACRISL